MRLRFLPALLAGVALSPPAGAQPRAAERPTLVVFFTVDQLTPVYFTRYAPQFTGGLARLWNGGAVFTDAYHDHGVSETAPGHATVMSGRFPSHTGIVRNNAGVEDPQAPLVGVPNGPGGASPFRFRGTVLTDWLRTADPRTRALSVSRKDRGAILPLGRAHQSVFWYDGRGAFTTSTYYADTLPDWVKRFNARGGGALKRYAGQAWTLLLPPNAYPEPDSVPAENGGRAYTFPHVLRADSTAAAELTQFPWMDQLTLDLALDGLQALKLGAGPQTDVLAVSLSTTDAVGHRYGMDSREIHDHVLRLDRMVGAFLDSVYKLRDSTRVVVALTADHGMAPYPQLHFPGADPQRGRAAVGPVIASVRQALVARGAPASALDFESGVVLLDRAALQRARVNPDSALRALLAELRRVKGVMRVYQREELASLSAKGDKYARRWLHVTAEDLPAVAYVTLEPYYYYSTITNATHGSPHDYDTHVPVIFYGAPFKPGKYGGYVRTVDIAPTLAAVLGVRPTEPLDGVVLRAALK